GAFTYTPNTGYTGNDAFSFKVNDGTVNSADATVTVHVDSTNTAPVATPQSIKATLNTTYSGQLAGTDVNGDTLTFSTGSTLAAHGIVQITTSGAPGVTTPIYYGQVIGDTNGVNAVVSTSAPGGPDNGNLLVYVDTTLACTLPNTASGGKCSDTLFTGQNAGAHTVYATFTGDLDYAPSTSPKYDVQILPDVTTTTLVSSGSPSILGTPVTFTATVAAPYATPVGPVTFFVDGVSAGPGTLSAAGVATFSISTLTVGTHTILATYAATLNFLGSSSSAIPQVVTYPPSPTTTTLTSNINPSYYLQNVTFTATVVASAPLSGPLAGTVTFYDGTASLGTSTISTLG
ncbi:MAG: Ig-like domain repeat protein, partial [Acidobacteriota bacterium]